MFRSKAVSSELPYVSCLLKVDTANRNLLINTPEAWLKTHNALQSASFHVVICINLHGNLTQVTAQDDRSEGIEAIKWLRTGMEMASHKG